MDKGSSSRDSQWNRAGATALINESLDNTGYGTCCCDIYITPVSEDCAGTSFNLVVTVNPTSVITSAAARNCLQ